MSLIDEALRKARLEAAQKDAERRGLPSPAAAAGLPGRPAWRRSRRGPVAAGVAVAVLVVALALGAGIYLGRRPAGGGTTSADVAPSVAAPRDGTGPALGGAASEPGAETGRPGGTETATSPAGGNGESEHSPVAGSATTGDLEEAPAEPPPSADGPAPSGAPAQAQTATPPARNPPPESFQPPSQPPAAATPGTTAATPPAPPPAAPPPATAGPPSAAHKPAPHAGEPSGEPVYRREAPTADGGKLVLSGIAWRETDPVAVLNGEILGIGEGTAGYSIVGIERDRIHLRGPEGTITIYIP